MPCQYLRMNRRSAVAWYTFGVVATAGFIWLEFVVLGRQEWAWTLSGIIGAALIPGLIGWTFSAGRRSWRLPNADDLRLEAQSKKRAAEALAAESLSRKAAGALDAYVAVRAREVGLQHRVDEFAAALIRLQTERALIEDEAWRIGAERDAIPAEALAMLDDLERSEKPKMRMISPTSGAAPIDAAAAALAARAERAFDRWLTARRRARALTASVKPVETPSDPADVPELHAVEIPSQREQATAADN